VYIKVPMPYTRSMRLYTTNAPDFYHVGYRVFADPTGVVTFNPHDPASDVVSLLSRAGTGDPKPPMPGAVTVPGTASLAPGATAALADLPGPGVISKLALTPAAGAASAAPTAPTARTPGSGSLQLPVDPSNSGVRVTVRTPAGGRGQRNPVSVNGHALGRFTGSQQPGGSTVQSLDIPAAVSAGKSRVALDNLVLTAGASVSSAPVGTGRATSVTVTPSQAAAASSSPPSGGFPAGLRLRISFDGRRTVDSPVDEFFGSGLGDYSVNSLMMALRPGGEHVSWWPMPYASATHVELYNGSGQPVSVSSSVTYAPSTEAANLLGPGGDGGYFSANSAAGTTVAGHDWPFLDTAGTGKVVGVAQTVHGTGLGLTYLEGDERAAADGPRTPQIHGTGTEDFYQAGWYFSGGPFSLPLNGLTAHQVQTSGCADECVSMYRLLLGDSLPFSAAERFGIEHGPMDDVSATYGSTTFWYGRSQPSAKVTGNVDVGVSSSESAAGYSGAAPVAALTSAFTGPDVRTPIKDELRSGTGQRAFRLPIDPANQGVTLRRMSDEHDGNQAATVTVDGQPAGNWQEPLSDGTVRWLDDDFPLAPSLTAGKSSLLITITPQAGSPPWTDARYTAIAVVPFYSDPLAPTVAPMDASYDSSNGILLSWRTAADDSPAVHYRVYRGTTLIGDAPSTGFADRSAPLGAPLHYSVVPVDPSGNAGPATPDAAVVTGTRALVEGEWSIADGHSIVQDMTGFGSGWSGGAQAWLTATGAGQRMDFDINVPTTGTFGPSAWLTRARDYGTTGLSVDGVTLGPAFNGYDPNVVRVGPIPFGFKQLSAGTHRLSFTVLNRDVRSAGYYVGVDALQLDLVGTGDPIPSRYAQLGGSSGILGSPSGTEHVQGTAIVQTYTKGILAWTPDAGVHEAHGAIFSHYRDSLGGAAGVLGVPITDETTAPDGVGRFNHFQYGSMYWTPSTGAHEVHGAIRDRWASLGWERSRLGYPTSDEFAVSGGRRNNFVHGSITWTAATGAISVVIV
jgi:hypothetical protein